MELIQQKINEHKNRLKNFINNLISTQNINDEILYNNEIKKEVELMATLLNSKLEKIRQINQMNYINVIFLSLWDNKKTSIVCSKLDTISVMIQKYRNKAKDQDINREFSFNGLELNPSLKVYESGIKESSLIHVLQTKGITSNYIPENGFELKFIKINKPLEQPIIIGIKPNDKFEKAILIYSNFICTDLSIVKRYKFYSNNIQLNPSLTLAQNGIINKSIIYVEININK